MQGDGGSKVVPLWTAIFFPAGFCPREVARVRGPPPEFPSRLHSQAGRDASPSTSKGNDMSNSKATAESRAESKAASKAATLALGTPFKEMLPQKKLFFVLKVVACVVSFGFIFPNVMMD